MLTVNLNEAKTHLARLVEQAAQGEPFVITKAGKTLVKVTALHPPKNDQTHRLGSLYLMTRITSCCSVLPAYGKLRSKAASDAAIFLSIRAG